MILPDLNLILHAHDRDALHHATAHTWWEGLLNGTEPVAIPWVVVLGFLRLMTHRSVLVHPMSPTAALAQIRAWFAQPNVEHLEPGPQHIDLLDRLLSATGTASDLTTDAYLAALAIEHQCELHSNDNDFARFPGLRWSNPLSLPGFTTHCPLGPDGATG